MDDVYSNQGREQQKTTRQKMELQLSISTCCDHVEAEVRSL
jgi:hypothetical protein